MRALAIIPALFIPIFAAVGSCASSMQEAQSTPHAEAAGNDCAVMAAVSKEHYKFGADNPPPPLKGLGVDGWQPNCDWAKYGLSFTEYKDQPSADPRERLKWVEFQKPDYDSQGATIRTSIMHGPLAGMGYECRLRSGIAGWTVSECRTAWVS